MVRPNGVQQGHGICRRCAGRVWDAFYVVSSDANFKIGVTSGDADIRLKAHRRDGYEDMVRLLTQMPPGQAAVLERICLAALADVKIEPVHGREYFAIESGALATVLDIVDGWVYRPRPSAARQPTRLPTQVRRSAQLALF
jgi:hypothetical protein